MRLSIRETTEAPIGAKYERLYYMNMKSNAVGVCTFCEEHCSLNYPGCSRGVWHSSTRSEPAADSNPEPSPESSTLGRHREGGHGGRGSSERDGATQSKEDSVLSKLYGCSHLLHHRKKAQQAQGQGRLLAILVEQGPTSQRSLQDIMDVRSASLSELLGKMEASGYITRERNEEDKRSINISLTDKGTKTAEQSGKEHKKSAKELLSVLDETELDQLDTTLSKLLHAWDPEEEHNPNKRRGCHKHGEGDGAGMQRGKGHHHQERSSHDGCPNHHSPHAHQGKQDGRRRH